MNTTRRQLLIAAALGCAGCAARAAAGRDAGSGGTGTGVCTDTTDAGDGSYCLASVLRVSVPQAAKLQVGDAVLLNVDDNNAVIVARDARGLYARSGICTHACCVVSLCSDAGCGTLTPSPLACSTTPIVQPDPGAGIVCPCHGSTFRLMDGSVTKGPARNPLPCYEVGLQGTDVWVDTGAVVDPTTRI